MRKIGINLLVFKEDLDNGRKQSEILKEISNLNVSIAEVRREYIKDFEEELYEIRQESEKYKLEVFYSVPEKISIDGKLNNYIEEYFKEAKIMNATHIKFNIGTLDRLISSEIDKLKEVIKEFNMDVTIENDQTVENGNLNSVIGANKFIENNNFNIGYTFDAGNWFWQNEDPNSSFEVLKSDITVFHLKDAKVENNKPKNVLVLQGKVNLGHMVENLSKSVPIIIEYPISSLDINSEVNKVKELVNGR